MGSLLEAAKARKRKPSTPCTVGELLKHPEYGDDIQEALDAWPNISYEDLARTCNDFGLQVKAGSFGYHNRRNCSCPPPEAV